jgi:uncharacterized membrane protein (DUF2068 family)
VSLQEFGFFSNFELRSSSLTAMGTQTDLIKKPAPTLYAIIALKLLKGVLFLALAIVIYALSDNDLPADLRTFLQHLRVNPERKFWIDVARRVGSLSEASRLWAAAGTLIYSLFSLVEGVGLMFRVSWAGWMAICESAFFIPIEIYELVHRSPAQDSRNGHPLLVTTILLINIWIVWYLAKNKDRLFRHHHHHHH